MDQHVKLNVIRDTHGDVVAKAVETAMGWSPLTLYDVERIMHLGVELEVERLLQLKEQKLLQEWGELEDWEQAVLLTLCGTKEAWATEEALRLSGA